MSEQEAGTPNSGTSASASSAADTHAHKRKQQPQLPPRLLEFLEDFRLREPAALCLVSGLEISEAQKSELCSIYEHLVAMKARVRQKRGRMAELAHTYGFAEEDLA